MKYARCFRCMKKGHRARDCKVNVSFSKCGQEGHHVSLCERQEGILSPKQMSFKFLREWKDENPSAKSPGIFHVGAGGRVALQTARAVIRREGDPYRVRVLFDAGSHRSFITSRTAQRSQLPVIRRDWLGISTFGQRSKDVFKRCSRR